MTGTPDLELKFFSLATGCLCNFGRLFGLGPFHEMTIVVPLQTEAFLRRCSPGPANTHGAEFA